MAENADNTKTIDPGLSVLVALLRFHGIGADAEQLQHRFGTDRIGVQEMLRSAKDFGLKARAYQTSWGGWRRRHCRGSPHCAMAPSFCSGKSETKRRSSNRRWKRDRA